MNGPDFTQEDKGFNMAETIERPHGNLGKQHTPETIQKMKESHTGVKLTEEEKQHLRDLTWADENRLEHLRTQALIKAKSIRRLDNGKIYESIESASKDIGCSSSSLRQALNENRQCKGIVFEFITEDNIGEFKPVLAAKPKTHKTIKRLDTNQTWNTLKEAAKEFGVSTSYFCECLKSNKLCRGVQFVYCE